MEETAPVDRPGGKACLDGGHGQAGSRAQTAPPEVLHKAPQANIKAELALRGFPQRGFPGATRLRPIPRGDVADCHAVGSGRSYVVAVTTTYPHVFPGDLPNDKIIRPEDTNGDGTADRSTVFAEGLNIPTGMEWGDGGIYVGQNTEILFLQDPDDDGRADRRRVVLGGFGNGDSHQTINSFIWSPGENCTSARGTDANLASRRRGDRATFSQRPGFYRLRPRRLQLDPLLDDFMGPGNPWGVAFNGWGQIFSIDGAGGVTYLSPGRCPPPPS
ncbi:MAG: hypothetical protein Ct9H300mP1_35620 [Planctomycetaceae bacterium]|nr:MAG: hypothetical protein Ct9H300mP1_35620 [Planctomycetaceae bacterium]